MPVQSRRGSRFLTQRFFWRGSQVPFYFDDIHIWISCNEVGFMPEHASLRLNTAKSVDDDTNASEAVRDLDKSDAHPRRAQA